MNTKSRSRRRLGHAVVGLVLLFGATRIGAGETAVSTPPDGPRFHAVDAQLESLIVELQAGNPGLQAARRRAEAGEARVPQSRALPDPQVVWRWYAESPETRVGPQRQSLELSQSVPWFNKRELAGRRSAQLADSLDWQTRALELALVARLKRLYFEAGYLREALAVNRDEKALLARFERIALTRYATGEGIQQSVIKVQTDITRLDDQYTRLQQQLDSVAHEISRLLGRPGRTIDLGPIELFLPGLEVDADRLVEEATFSHPEVRATTVQVSADETWLESRRLDRRPDFRFGVGYTQVDRREDAAGMALPPEGNGDDILALTVGLTIPLWGRRNEARVAEAEESLGARRAALQDVRDRLTLGVREGLLRARSLEERVRLHREVLIPQAEESLASSEAAYTTDRQGFLDLLDAERIVFQVRLTVRRLLADCWIALTDVEEALGREFPAPDELHVAREGADA